MFLRPWIALVLLAQAGYEFPEHTINRALLEHAHAHRIATEFLDSWEQQVLYLDESITAKKLASAIHDFDKMRCGIEDSAAAFSAGEDAAFANDVSSGDSPVLARIERWHARLADLAESGRRVFVAVGVGQLVGPSGLLTRFAADGYQVRRL